jgi:hypothetical protein
MLPLTALPRSAAASFNGNWSREGIDESFLADVVARWAQPGARYNVGDRSEPPVEPRNLAALLRQLKPN